jgi:hypothetical protein
MSSTFGEKKRTSGLFGREGIVGGPFLFSLHQAHEENLVGLLIFWRWYNSSWS